MSTLQWSDDFSVKVQAMDVQHQRLIELMNELDLAMKQGKGNEAVGKVMDSLLDYTSRHFYDEEQLMLQYEYPDYAEHFAKHEAITRQVLKMKSESSDNHFMAIKLMSFLSDWLSKHIMGTDMKYGEHILANGGIRDGDQATA